MAKGNNGNYLQHCIEVEAAVRLARLSPNVGLHVALTHGMKPFEQFEDPKKGSVRRLVCDALREAVGKPQDGEREIVKAYRASWSKARRPKAAGLSDDLRTKDLYPNSAELLRAIIGTEHVSGGITERNGAKCAELAAAWVGSKVRVEHSSWRTQLDVGGALYCPDNLDAPWLFSMDPMTYTENGIDDDDKLHRSDLPRLTRALRRYFASGQHGVASLFVFNVGIQQQNPQSQFWAFMDELAGCLGVPTASYWVAQRGGNRNLAGLLFSSRRLAEGFNPPNVNQGRGR